MSQHRFDGVVREIVTREESRLPTLLSLPGGRAIGARAAEGRTSVRAFLDSNYDWPRAGHDVYLMYGLAFLQHLDELLNSVRASISFLGGLNSEEDGSFVCLEYKT